MALVIPDAAEVAWLKRALYDNAGSENLSLRLYKTNVTPAESDTAGSYTVADFTSYANKTITSSQAAGTWAVPTTSTGTTSSTYGTSQTWTAGSTQTVYGIYYVFASSGTIAGAEAFSGAKTVDSGDTITVIPKIALE